MRTHRWSLRWLTTAGLGMATLAAFLIKLVTGVLLMFYYKPYPDVAYESIKDIHFVVPTGRFIGNIHRWAANVMVIAVILHMARVFYTAAYRRPREYNWLIGMGLLVVTLALSFTGYLLPWDQLAYWAITIGANIAQSPREVTDALGITDVFDPGGLQRLLLLGSDTVGAEALIRFYLLHVMLLPLALALLAAAAAEENFFREWRKIQGAARGEAGPLPVQLRQIVNPSLRTADRCVSCHAGMAPGEGLLRGGDVLRPHKPVVHDPAEYGCTVCHGGQGQATDKEDAHGRVEFWPEPMLPREISWAGCGACHVSLGVPGEKSMKEAEFAFERLDCYACHRVDGRGGTIRPDGGGMEGPDLSFAGIRGYDTAWHEKHVKKAATAGGAWSKSFSPVSPEDQRRMEVFLRTRIGASALVAAKSVFLGSGCLGCHKVNGVGGDDGPDLSSAGLKDPGRLNFAGVPGGRHVSAWMAEHFRSPVSVVAGSQMPPVPLPEEGIRRLTVYTMSLRARELPERYVPRDRVRAVRFGEREFASDGETIFGAFCSGCHGPEGAGRRLLGLVSFPSVANPDFLALAPDELILRTIEQGRPGRRMPGWLKPDGLREEEVRAVLSWLRETTGVPPERDPRPARWVSSDAARGRALFERYCSGCHGPEGKGGEGPALNNKVLMATATDTFLVETIRRGRRGTAMAGFADATPVRPALAQADIEAVVAYLGSLQGGKS